MAATAQRRTPRTRRCTLNYAEEITTSRTSIDILLTYCQKWRRHGIGSWRIAGGGEPDRSRGGRFTNRYRDGLLSFRPGDSGRLRRRAGEGPGRADFLQCVSECVGDSTLRRHRCRLARPGQLLVQGGAADVGRAGRPGGDRWRGGPGGDADRRIRPSIPGCARRWGARSHRSARLASSRRSASCATS